MPVRTEIVEVNGVKAKRCSKCNEDKPLECFHTKGSYVDGEPIYRSWCIECSKKDNLRRYKTKYKGLTHQKAGYRYTLKTRYGMSENEFQEMYSAQNGRCKVCETELGNVFDEVNGIRCNVDHCHSSGAVRGILCQGCNTGLGQFKDSIEVLEKAIRYLKDAECC